MEKKKFLKLIFIIILLLLLLFAIHVIRNYIIISKIANKQEKLAQLANYSFSIEKANDVLDKITIQYYLKDKNSMEVIENNDKVLFINWYDSDTNEKISICPSESTVTIGKSNNNSSLYIPTAFSENNSIENLLCATTSFISYDKINGEKCYVINTFGLKDYISVEDGTLLKNINGFEYKDYKFNELTDELMKKPNFTGYTVNV